MFPYSQRYSQKTLFLNYQVTFRTPQVRNCIFLHTGYQQYLTCIQILAKPQDALLTTEMWPLLLGATVLTQSAKRPVWKSLSQWQDLNQKGGPCLTNGKSRGRGVRTGWPSTTVCLILRQGPNCSQRRKKTILLQASLLRRGTFSGTYDRHSIGLYWVQTFPELITEQSLGNSISFTSVRPSLELSFSRWTGLHAEKNTGQNQPFVRRVEYMLSRETTVTGGQYSAGLQHRERTRGKECFS